jgi:chorismate-pyruvate lyase
MRQDWKDEAVWLAAESFAYDRDLDAAQARLRPLGSDDLGALVLERTEKAIEQNLAARHITHLARLAAALGARSTRTDPYLNP